MDIANFNKNKPYLGGLKFNGLGYLSIKNRFRLKKSKKKKIARLIGDIIAKIKSL